MPKRHIEPEKWLNIHQYALQLEQKLNTYVTLYPAEKNRIINALAENIQDRYTNPQDTYCVDWLKMLCQHDAFSLALTSSSKIPICQKLFLLYQFQIELIEALDLDLEQVCSDKFLLTQVFQTVFSLEYRWINKKPSVGSELEKSAKSKVFNWMRNKPHWQEHYDTCLICRNLYSRVVVDFRIDRFKKLV